MKTAIKKSLLVVLMLGTLISYANENLSTINVLDGKKVKVEFKTVKKGNTIKIKDENSVTLYSKEIEATGRYSKIFDLSALKAGNYTTELEKDFEIIIRKFKVDENGLVILNKNENTVFKPVVRTKNDLVLISKIAFDNKPLQVVLLYKDNIIYAETVNDSSKIVNRVYKVSKEERGDYKIVINSNDRLYVKNFKI